MRGEDFIDLAAFLGEAGSEPAYRSAVSRAYYGAFHVAKQLLADVGIGLPGTGEAHRKVLFCLQQCGERDGKAAGGELEVLRDQRNIADYDLGDPRFRQKASAEKAIELSRQIVERITAIRAEPVWSRFRAEVRRYAAEVLRLPVAP
jgi:uncharacterized protein (UPF0332 family)